MEKPPRYIKGEKARDREVFIICDGLGKIENERMGRKIIKLSLGGPIRPLAAVQCLWEKCWKLNDGGRGRDFSLGMPLSFLPFRPRTVLPFKSRYNLYRYKILGKKENAEKPKEHKASHKDSVYSKTLLSLLLWVACRVLFLCIHIHWIIFWNSPFKFLLLCLSLSFSSFPTPSMPAGHNQLHAH